MSTNTKITPSSLQAFNVELIKGLESLKSSHRDITSQLACHESRQQSLLTEIQKLQEQLQQLTNQIKKEKEVKEQYETLIHDTERAYAKLVDSSQTILRVMNNQSKSLLEKRK